MGTFRLLAWKTARMLLTVFIISTVVFFILRVIPGDPAYVVAGMDAPPEAVEAVRKKLGTDKPVLTQYAQWMLCAAKFDFGTSLLSQERVSSLILDRFPLTLLLSVSGMALACLIALPLGILSAVKRWSLWDYLCMVFSQIGMSLPSFWLAILLLLVFSSGLNIFPLFGSDTPLHLVLPVLALGLGRAAVLLRMIRTSMVTELGKEYIITAVSKGLPEKIIRYRHALRNALLPVITFSGIQFGYMLGGSIVIEQVFSLPGLGRLILSAIYQRDFPVIQGGVIFFAVVFCCVNFLVDLLYSYINPRIRVS
jgi:peptide/nickel transport system permease protein